MNEEQEKLQDQYERLLTKYEEQVGRYLKLSEEIISSRIELTRVTDLLEKQGVDVEKLRGLVAKG